MMGEKAGSQDQLFYRFNLDEHVPADHLLRKIDAVLDLSGLRAQLAPHYSHTGRPSIDPELMIRMLLIGYCYGIRSERRLCEEVQLNLAYRWFCRLGLEDPIPDQSTFSKNRHGRFRDADILRHVFEATVATCMENWGRTCVGLKRADLGRFDSRYGAAWHWPTSLRSLEPAGLNRKPSWSRKNAVIVRATCLGIRRPRWPCA